MKKISTPIGILIVLSFAIFTGAILIWQLKEKSKMPSPESIIKATTTPSVIEPQKPYSTIDELNFIEEKSVKEYKIGTALFKIFPRIEMNFGYFEAYNKGQRIYGSEPVFAISDLLSFEYRNNKYIVISEYSGGAHCCFRAFIFILDTENNLKLIETLDLGNAFLAKDNLFFKDDKLYLLVDDDRFAYFYTPYAGSYFFKKYYSIEGDKLIIKNSDFKEEYISEATKCKDELNAYFEKVTRGEIDASSFSFELLSPYLVCITANYILAGSEEHAWQELHEIYTTYPFLIKWMAENTFKKEIKEKMEEYLKIEEVKWQMNGTYRNEEYGFEFKYPSEILFMLEEGEPEPETGAPYIPILRSFSRKSIEISTTPPTTPPTKPELEIFLGNIKISAKEDAENIVRNLPFYYRGEGPYTEQISGEIVYVILITQIGGGEGVSRKYHFPKFYLTFQYPDEATENKFKDLEQQIISLFSFLE